MECAQSPRKSSPLPSSHCKWEPGASTSKDRAQDPNQALRHGCRERVLGGTSRDCVPCCTRFPQAGPQEVLSGGAEKSSPGLRHLGRGHLFQDPALQPCFPLPSPRSLFTLVQELSCVSMHGCPAPHMGVLFVKGQ